MGEERIQGCHQDSVNTHLCQNSGKQGRGRRRSHRMGFRQPDMHRKHTCLAAKAEQNTYACCKDHLRLLRPADSLTKIREGQGPCRKLQQREAHEQHQSADHGDEQIGITGPDRAGRLFVNDPGEGGEGKDLKEDEGRHQIPGKHHAFRSAQRHDHKEPVPVQVLPFLFKVLLRKQRGPCPHDGRDHRVDRTESVHREGQPSGQNVRDRKRRHLPEQKKRQNQFRSCDADHEHIPEVLIFPADHIGQDPTDKRSEDHT